jgi:AcrR family transcriptional regulator
VEAATQELAEKGFEAFSVRSVARRSGVSRPSLLLRWPDKDSLIIDTLASISEWPCTDPAGGLRDELSTLVRGIVDLLDPTTSPRGSTAGGPPTRSLEWSSSGRSPRRN